MGLRVLGVVLVLLAVAASPASAAQPAYVPGELLVRFAPGVDAGERAALRREHELRAVHALPVPGLQLVRLAADASAGAAIERLEREPGVLYAERNALYAPLATPDDPFLSSEWGLHNAGQTVQGDPGTADADIDAPEAWNRTTGSPAVTVAIVDSGVAYDHPDLAPNIWANPGETGGGKETNGLDDDANGFVDDVRGWDFLGDDNEPLDANGHGTSVAGVVGARGDNAREIAGVNWDVALMPVRIGGGYQTDITADRITAAFAYAVDNGADVVNASFGSAGFSQATLDVVEAAPDVLFVAGAGNDATDNDVTPFYPCNLAASNVVCVAATDNDDALATYSNFGAAGVDLAAPGTTVVSTGVALDPPLFTETFEADIAATWTTGGDNNTWGRTSTAAATGSFSLADSPGGNYVDDTSSIARNTNPFSLAGQNGCSVLTQLRMDVRTEIQPAPPVGVPPKDDFVVIASPTPTGAGAGQVGRRNGSIPAFGRMGFDLTPIDDDPDAYLILALVSNTDGKVGDGVYVDDIQVRCLASSYPDPTLVVANGTSLATPFVSGVAALLLAAEPSLSTAQIRQRLLSSVDPKPALAGKVVSGGRLNAAKTLTPPPPPDDPDPPDTTPPPPPPPPPIVDVPPPPPPFVPPPAPDLIAPVLELSGSTRQRAARTLVVRARCPAEACRLTAAGTALRRRLRAATGAVPAGGTARLVLRVGRPALKAIRRALRRRRKVSVKVTVVATDAAGNATTRRRTIRLRR
jgi:subtilisin family serine protease